MEEKQKNQYDLIDFKKFNMLKNLFYQPNFEASKILNLSLVKQNITDVPPVQCLKALFNLQAMNLGQNQIKNFTSKNIIEGCYQIKELSFQDNQIDDLNDLQKLGSLAHLEQLNFNDNPVCSYLTRAQLIRQLINPDKFKTYNPVKTLMSLYQNIPKLSFDQQNMNQAEQKRQIIEKTHFEITEQMRIDILNGNKQQPVKTKVIKNSMTIAPKNRLFRFSNLIKLNDQPIYLLEVLQATGTSELDEIISSHQQQNQRHSTQNIAQTQRKKVQSSVGGRKQIFSLSQKQESKFESKAQTQRDPAVYSELVQRHHRRIEKELNQMFSQKPQASLQDQENKKSNQSRNDYSIEPTQKFKIKALAHRFNAKRYTNDQQFMPDDLQYKDYQYEVSIEEYKNMMRGHEQEKIDKQIRKQQQLEKYKKRASTIEKQKKLRQKVMIPEEYYNYEQFKDNSYESTDSIKNVYYRKGIVKKPKLTINQEADISIDSYKSSLQEDLSQQSKKKIFDIDLSVSDQESEDFYHEELIQKKTTIKENPSQQNFICKEAEKIEYLGSGKVQILGKFNSQDIKNDPITIDDILPKNEQILSKKQLESLKKNPNPQLQLLLECKNIIEGSKYVLKQTQEMDKKIKIQTNKHLNVSYKKITGYEQILEYLKIIDKGNLNNYKDINTYILRDLIYYINEFKNSDEPKLNSRIINETLKQKGLKQADIDQLYKCLDIIENIKLQESKHSGQKQQFIEASLKRIERKEIERAEANAILASHYLRIKKYYPVNLNQKKDGKFDKYLKKLHMDIFDDVQVGGVEIKKSQHDQVQTSIKEKSYVYKEKGIKMTNYDHLMERKEQQIDDMSKYKQDQIKDPFYQKGKSFDEQMDFILRKMSSQDSQNQLKGQTLEQKMIMMAQDLKENSKRKEQFIQKIDKIIPEIKQQQNEFWKNEEINHEKRYDKAYCQKEFVKAIREGKKKL